MTTTSPNQEGVEGTACEEVWMITGESVILFTYASFVRNPFILPHQEGIFLGWLARDYTSLRNSWARQEPCVFYYLSDGPDGRPRMCGNPHFSRCIHQLMCIECEAFIDHEQAEAIEKREGAIVISVPIPLPPQMVAELNAQDEAGSDATTKREVGAPPMLPG